VTLDDIGMENVSPLIENYVTELDIGDLSEANDYPFLPCQPEKVQQDLTKAVLAVNRFQSRRKLYLQANLKTNLIDLK